MESVDWFDAISYCNARSAKEGLAAAYAMLYAAARFAVVVSRADERLHVGALSIGQVISIVLFIGGLAATLPSNALAYADKGLALTAGLIPRRFNGTIPWEHPGNKAFYRLLFAAALANICNGTFEKAMHIIKVSLARNPADPLGIRNLIDELPARCVY